MNHSPTCPKSAEIPSYNSTSSDPQKTVQPSNETWRWVGGCLLALGGLGYGNPVMMAIWLAMAAVLIPPTATRIEEKFEMELDRKKLTTILIAGAVATLVVAAMMAAGSMNGGEGGDYDKWINRVGEIGSPMP